jgi:hypothetical protein
MKKLFVVLLALAVIGVFAFAQDAPAAKLSVGGWGRMWFNAVQSVNLPGYATGAFGTADGKAASDLGVTAGPGWANNGARVSVSFSGSSENMGFDWNPGVSNNQMTAVCDQAKIWAKISPMLTVQVGKIQGDVLRGKLDDFGDILPVGGKDNIFTRFNPSTGILLDVRPIDGVYLGASIDAGAGTKATDAYKAIQIGAGYTIADIGLIRAQYIGKGGPKAYGTDAAIQAAFAYTGMAGLTVDAGATIPTNSDSQMRVSAGASYSAGPLSTYERADVEFGGPSGAVLNFMAAGQVFYTVADPLSVGVEVAFSGMGDGFTVTDYKNAAGTIIGSGIAKDNRYFDIYPVVKLGYSNGYIKVGFDASVGLDGQDLKYALPIQLEYWF